jgi:hypothetical protein
MQLSNEDFVIYSSAWLQAGWPKIVRGTGFGIIGDILVGRWRAGRQPVVSKARHVGTAGIKARLPTFRPWRHHTLLIARPVEPAVAHDG